MVKVRGCPEKGDFVIQKRLGNGKEAGNDFLDLGHRIWCGICGQDHYIWVSGERIWNSGNQEKLKQR
jgi:uncharacterized protein YuzB (UPF0349 family)